jgi:hypothetical protein
MRIDPSTCTARDGHAILFWAKLDRSGGRRACWPWRGQRSQSGYGRTKWPYRDARETAAHRVAYELVHGPIPAGMLVCHRCDNPPCCNPFHLFLGTHLDNTVDMLRKGRAGRGSKRGSGHWNAKLTEADVLAIRQRLAAGGEKQQTIAADYGVCPPTICSIKRGLTWRHVR